jgi:hypothetical protein
LDAKLAPEAKNWSFFFWFFFGVYPELDLLLSCELALSYIRATDKLMQQDL